MKREAFKYAGKTVKIKDEVKDLGGADYVIEDYWENVSGKSWMNSDGNIAAMIYGMRVGLNHLPLDNEVVYGKIGGLGNLVHVSQLVLPEEE